MHLLTSEKKQKLRLLANAEGYRRVDEMLAAAALDTCSPAICCNNGCTYTCEMEPDQDRGWCDECSTNSMQSALILAGLI